MSYDQMNSFIDSAAANGITYIFLEFIVLNDPTLSQLTYFDTLQAWMGFTQSQQQTLLNKIRGNNMFLLASFGGATSFPNGFQQILNSPKYADPSVLANDLVTFAFNNNIPGIDL